MRIDGGSVQDNNDFSPIPDGKYLVKVVNVEQKITKERRDEMWALSLAVQGGPYANRLLFDNVVFRDEVDKDGERTKASQTCLSRAKLILKRLGGLDVDGIWDFTPDDLLNKQCLIETVVEEQTYNNKTQKKNVILFDGYEALPSEYDKVAEELPF